MRQTAVKHLDAGGQGFDPMVRRAVQSLREGAA
jgi:hypothetical protein